MAALSNLLRNVVNNRRRHPRKHRRYEVVLRNEHDKVIFRGKTANISQSGARLVGLPTDLGIAGGERVLVEILVPPRGASVAVRRIATVARVVRTDETPDSFIVAIRFEQGLHL